MSKKLVAYFSASGVTAKIAGQLAEAIGADIHEIKPKVKYTKADLDWRDNNSRSSVEMSNKAFRPELAETDLSVDEYDTVFVGFPIWWYVAPTIVNTFLEKYDFSGKKIVVFATSGSSKLGNTVKELKISVSQDTEIIEGKVLNGSYTNEELDKWVSSLGL